MKNDLVSILFLILFFGSAREAFALKLSSQELVPISRWDTESKEKMPANDAVRKLIEIKKFLADKKVLPCTRAADSALGSSKIIGPWILLARLQCSLLAQSDVEFADAIRGLTLAEKNKDWLLIGPFSDQIKSASLEVSLNVLEAMMKKDRIKSGETLDRLFSKLSWMSSTQKARVFRLAGEMAFVQQRLKIAEGYFRRSLLEKDSSEVRERIDNLETLLREQPPDQKVATASGDKMLEGTAQERELADRMAMALRTGDLVAAVEDGVEIITSFSGGQRAKWATDRIYEVYASVAVKTDPKFVALKQRILREMESVDGLRIYNWCEKAFRQGYYGDVSYLFKQGSKKLQGTSYMTKLVSWGAHSFLYIGDSDRARQLFQELVTKHAGTSESVTALFRSGLIDFRKSDFISAAAQFERLLVLPGSENLELQTRYWLWRSLQKSDATKAAAVADIMVAKFPLTYYGLRAKAESAQNILTEPMKEQNIVSEVYLSAPEKIAFERLNLLLKAGWHAEAKLELKSFVEPTDAKSKVLFARLWASAMGYPTAIRLINQAWDENMPETFTPSIFRIAFPSEFKSSIRDQAKKYGLEAALVQSLIRQESSFESDAVSTSGAQGLMQLIPGTADEMKVELGLNKAKTPVSVTDPAINIQLGTRYLKKMMDKYSGNVTWALAAYNAGPDRFGKWAETRKLENAPVSDPMNEVWIDELPWSETSFYVKAILRNLLLYRLLDRGRVLVANPIWMEEQI